MLSIFKRTLDISVRYLIPVTAIALSILSYRNSREAQKVQAKLNVIEEKIKNYELDEIKRKQQEATKACVEVRIINISPRQYKLKVWNSGQATAYNVDFEIPKDAEMNVIAEKVPFEFLEPGKSFEENALVHLGTARKFMMKTTWEDERGRSYFKEQLVTI